MDQFEIKSRLMSIWAKLESISFQSNINYFQFFFFNVQIRLKFDFLAQTLRNVNCGPKFKSINFVQNAAVNDFS